MEFWRKVAGVAEPLINTTDKFYTKMMCDGDLYELVYEIRRLNIVSVCTTLTIKAISVEVETFNRIVTN